MKILVTGGAGFIGSNVADGYIREGHEVVVVDSLITGKEENVNSKAKLIRMDIRSPEIHYVFEQERPQVVNHHAAQMSVPASVKDPKYDADVNVLGFLNVMEASVRYGTKKVVFISSGGAIYGEAGICPTPEDYDVRPLSPYAITKYVSEHYLNFYKHRHGMSYTVLRYANIYGPRQAPHAEAGVVAIFMEQMASGVLPAIFGYGGQPDGMTRDYCFVQDVVRANILALGDNKNGTYNIGTGRETDTLTLYRNILGSMRGEGYAIPQMFDNPKKNDARPGDLRRSCLDCSKASKDLGWKAGIMLSEGIQKTVEWYLKNR